MKKKRLEGLLSLAEPCEVAADIGTDHGFVPIALVQRNLAKKGIAADISRPSLEKSIQAVKDAGLEDRIDCRLGDGFQVLAPGEADTVILAGMGGVLISEIFTKHPKVTESVSTFLLQPMQGREELRSWLWRNGFTIAREKLFSEGRRQYSVLQVVHGQSAEDDPEFPLHLKDNDPKEVEKFYRLKRQLLENVGKSLEQMKNGTEKEIRQNIWEDRWRRLETWKNR